MEASTFGQLGYEPLNPFIADAGKTKYNRDFTPAKPALLGRESHNNKIGLLGTVTGSSAAEQFMLFQLGNAGVPLRDLTEITPGIEGSDSAPDVHASISLLAFHLADDKAQSVTDASRATLRLDLGKDPSSNSPLEPLFWSIAAGLDLYDHVSSGSNGQDPKRMSDDFPAKFRQRPVEIPGGLGQLRIEVMAHPEKPWWRRALGFFGEDRGVRQVVTSVGFPGIALDAVRLIDEMIGRFEDAAAEPLLRSRPLTLAFSEAARDDYVGGSDSARIGCITPGFYVLVRQADSDIFRQQPPLFLGHTGHLVPRTEWEKAPGTIDPEHTDYRGVTYAVLKVRLRATSLGGL